MCKVLSEELINKAANIIDEWAEYWYADKLPGFKEDTELEGDSSAKKTAAKIFALLLNDDNAC